MASYTITINLVPEAGGIIKIGSEVSGSTNVQEEGATVNLFAAPASGYAFSSYLIDGVEVSTAQSYSFTMPSNNITLTVNFSVVEEPDVVSQNILYDTSCPRFLIVKNLSERYFSGDLVDFSNTTYTEVEEPIGFDAGVFKLERDSEYHGFNYEFSVDSLSYEIGTVGYSYIKNDLLLSGTDSDLKFVFGYGNVNGLVVNYIGRIDMNEYREESNGEIISFGLRELDFDNLLQTAFELPQKTDPNKVVLLHSKVIPKTVEYSIENDDPLLVTSSCFLPRVGGFEELAMGVDRAIVKNGPTTGSYDAAYMFVNSAREGNDTLNDFYTYDFSVVTDMDMNVYEQNKFIGRAVESGVYKVEIKGTFGLRFFNTSSFSDPYPLQLVVAVTGRDGETIISTNTYEADLVETASSLLSSADVFLTFDRQVSVNLDFEQCLYVYYLIDVAGPRFPTYDVLNVAGIIEIKKLPFAFDFDAPTLKIEAQTFTKTSLAKFSSPKFLLDSTFKQAVGREDSIVVSDFFDVDGCGEKLFLTNGFNIRGGQVNEGVGEDEIALKVSPKDLFEMLSRVFNLGFGVEYNELKEEIVRIEPSSYFYGGGEILAFDSVSNYTKEIDTSRYYNEIEVGFSKYSKQREVDKGNTLDDFHTKHVYQTPIKTNKNKLSIVSNLVMSGYEIEILRRKQFENNGENNRSNYSEDENIFGVMVAQTAPFSGGTYSDVVETSVVTILNDVQDVYEVGSMVTYISRAGVSQTRRIKNVALTSGDTQIEFIEPLQGGSGVGNVTITITGTPRINCEKNENFALADFLVSPETAYNLRITPKRMLQNHANLINGGMFTKGASEEYVFKQGDGNVKLITAYTVGADCKLGDLDGFQVVEGGNIIIGDGVIEQASMMQGQFLFLPIKVSCSVNLTFGQLTEIKKCLRGQGTDTSKNYGYITINTPCGGTEQVLPTEIEYNPIQDEATIVGYLKTLS